DFCLLYTSLGLFHIGNPDEELRRACARAVNRMNAEMFAPYRARIAPAAVVPVYTPQEAIEEATYAVRELGMKAIMIANHVKRPVPAAAKAGGDSSHVRQVIDSLAYDSDLDYDPFWAKCLELKVAVTAHSGSMGWHGRETVDNFTYNHIGHFAAASHAFAKAPLIGGVCRAHPHLGHFAAASHAFAKALIIGGVVRRFPALRFAMLEGGVGWACNLLTDLVGHWQKRNGRAMEANLRPLNLERERLRELFTRYGGKVYEDRMEELMAAP